MGYDIGSVPTSQPLEGVAARALFGRVMLLVAVTCGFAALGAYAGRNLTGLQFLIPWIGALGCIVGLNVANARGQTGIALALLFGVGFLLGLAVGVTVVWYAENEPTVVWQAAGATGLTVAGMGTWGYATRRDLSYLYRTLFFALLGLIVFGLILVLFRINGAQTFYALAGIAIFSGYTLVDFNRLRRSSADQAIPIAAGIFLDVFNLFLLFLQLFGSGRN
ncbi:MAG TPA: Bax inhibitor-1 family protein [Thermoleophilaceae bacterium]|jgi:modulator of FtsH protease|nr:Bax inhibitor-1 family protein [Thermoleophilaceae bacterium]